MACSFSLILYFTILAIRSWGRGWSRGNCIAPLDSLYSARSFLNAWITAGFEANAVREFFGAAPAHNSRRFPHGLLIPRASHLPRGGRRFLDGRVISRIF